MSAQQTVGGVTVERHQDAADCIKFGIGELEAALAGAVTRSPPAANPQRITVESVEQPALHPDRSRYEAAVPVLAEAYIIRRKGNEILVLGRDAVGAMYGALELAEVVRQTGSLYGVADKVEQPFLAIRAVNQFLFEEALKDPNSWFYEEEFWEGYFALLARSRNNLLDLHAGYGLVLTNFPNIYPYFIYLDEFPDQCVGRAAAERNLAMLNRVIAIGRRHGVRVALMNYTVQGRKQEEKGEMFAGFDSDRLTRYTYQASRAFLRGCPGLWMYGFRIGESGQPEDFFKKTYLAAVNDSEFQGKLYTRSWLATRENIESIKRGFSGDFYIEVKYNGEKMGPPYQAITTATQFDASYSYEAYTNQPRDFELLYQVRANGTNRIFHWGDPEFVSRVARSCRLGSSAGYSVEPMTAYYPMTDRYHPANGHHYFEWTWQRDWFWYQLWGRLGYNPELASDVFVRLFTERFGPTGQQLYQLLTTASKVVPLVESAFTLGPDHRHSAPEFETGNPEFSGLNGQRTTDTIGGFLEVSPFDPTVMRSIAEAAAQEIADQPDGRMGARASADRLFFTADRIDELLVKIPETSSAQAEVQCIRSDAEALAALARFAGERYLAALNLAEFRLTSYPGSLSSARHHLRWAREYWGRLAQVADGHYAPLLETIRMRTQAYRWESQLAVIDGDLAYIGSLEKEFNIRGTRRPASQMAHMPGRGAQRATFRPETAAWPVQWRDSAYETLSLGGRPALRSHGGTLGFDVADMFLSNTDADIAIDVAYWNPGMEIGRRIRVRYDGVGHEFGSLTAGGSILLDGKPGWNHARLTLNHARLAGGGPGFSDIVFSSSDGGEFEVVPPAIHILRAPKASLKVYFPFALKQPPTNPSIHWRRPAEPWQVAPLVPGIGEQDMEAQPRSREIYQFEIPNDVEAFEYYFTAEWATDKMRLPVGEVAFKWRRPHEAVPVSIVAEAIESTRHDGTTAIQAHVSSPAGIARVASYFKPIPTDKPWQSVEMKEVAVGVYSATVPLTAEGLLYRFQVTDNLGDVVLYPDFERETPYRVIPPWNPAQRREAQTK